MIQKIKQCFNNIKYRSKLILLCILVSFLPLSVMGFFCYNQTINLLRTRELDSLESSILSVSNSLDSKVNTYQNPMCLQNFLLTMRQTHMTSMNI